MLISKQKRLWGDAGPVTDVCGVGLATAPFSVGKAISVYYPLGSLTEKGEMAVEEEGHS